MDEVAKNEPFQMPEALIDSKSGISWFERGRMAQGKPLRDEPQVSRRVDEIWNASETKKRQTQ